MKIKRVGLSLCAAATMYLTGCTVYTVPYVPAYTGSYGYDINYYGFQPYWGNRFYSGYYGMGSRYWFGGPRWGGGHFYNRWYGRRY